MSGSAPLDVRSLGVKREPLASYPSPFTRRSSTRYLR